MRHLREISKDNAADSTAEQWLNPELRIIAMIHQERLCENSTLGSVDNSSLPPTPRDAKLDLPHEPGSKTLDPAHKAQDTETNCQPTLMAAKDSSAEEKVNDGVLNLS